MKKRVTFDFETRSKSNLKKEGAYKYSLDPSTQVTCLGFKIMGHPTVYFLDFKLCNTPWAKLPDNFKNLWMRLINEGYEMSAHNAFFERCIYFNVLVTRLGWPKFNVRRLRCTAAKAAACALPRALEGAGLAMNLQIQKDKRGHIALMKICKPTKAWSAWAKLQKRVQAGERMTEKTRLKALEPEPKMFLDYEDDPETWHVMYRYCKIDVKSEEELDLSLPDLIPDEQELWHLNQKLNWRGLRIDLPTVKKIVSIIEADSKVKLKELDSLTMGLVSKPGARKSILEFLALDDIILPDIRSKTVSDSLEGFALSEDGRRLLELRKALSMTSTRKYYGMLDRVIESDQRVRDILLYHGASTGRDTGTGLQPHNFPRGLIKMSKDRPYSHVMNVAECDHEMLKLLYGDSLLVLFSALLRNMIIASEGKRLFVADFSKIEVAVLWWLCDNEPGLKVLREKKDPYKYQAAANTGKAYEEIEDEGDDRQLGKAQTLGCGFGMGANKFQTTAWDQYRVKLTIEESRKAVASYRKANAAVPEVWKAYEKAAIDAVKNKGQVFTAGKCDFFVRKGFLWIELPSGRRLAYKDPQIAWRVRQYDKIIEVEVDGEMVQKTVTEYTQPMETLEFWAVNSKTKKWALERTWGGTLCENIVQATARDLMAPALLRLDKAGYDALLAVHDEGITECDHDKGNLDEFTKIMCEEPAWGKGLPLDAKGWEGPRYRK